MTNTFEELEHALQIDLTQLDTVRVQHVMLYYDVCKGFRTALDARDKAKKTLKEVYGEQYFEARTKIEDTGNKPTEAMITAQLEMIPECQEVNTDLLDKESKLNSWTALKDAYEQRSYALSSLVELYLAGYFGTLSAEVVSPKSNDDKLDDKLTRFESRRTRSHLTNRG